MINLFTYEDIKDIEGYEDANSSWEYAEDRERLIDSLIDYKDNIADFINKLDLTSDAQSMASEYNGDFLQLYQEIRIGEKQYSVLIYEYSTEEQADFDSILGLINDMAWRTDEFNKNVLMKKCDLF